MSVPGGIYIRQLDDISGIYFRNISEFLKLLLSCFVLILQRFQAPVALSVSFTASKASVCIYFYCTVSSKCFSSKKASKLFGDIREIGLNMVVFFKFSIS